jgi:hypothetical protein
MTLTREEILAMEPGRELDMLVNQHLFGYSVRSHLAYKEGMKIDRTDFLPSTFLPNAWEVVEKMRETHIYELADFGRNKYKKAQHFAAFHSLDRPRDYERQVRAKKLPEAICKAALLAVLNL